MNPIERALGILLLLTGGATVPSAALAERFGVSVRTVYRDVERPDDARRAGGGDPRRPGRISPSRPAICSRRWR